MGDVIQPTVIVPERIDKTLIINIIIQALKTTGVLGDALASVCRTFLKKMLNKASEGQDVVMAKYPHIQSYYRFYAQYKAVFERIVALTNSAIETAPFSDRKNKLGASDRLDFFKRITQVLMLRITPPLTEKEIQVRVQWYLQQYIEKLESLQPGAQKKQGRGGVPLEDYPYLRAGEKSDGRSNLSEKQKEQLQRDIMVLLGIQLPPGFGMLMSVFKDYMMIALDGVRADEAALLRDIANLTETSKSSKKVIAEDKAEFSHVVKWFGAKLAETGRGGVSVFFDAPCMAIYMQYGEAYRALLRARSAGERDPDKAFFRRLHEIHDSPGFTAIFAKKTPESTPLIEEVDARVTIETDAEVSTTEETSSEVCFEDRVRSISSLSSSEDSEESADSGRSESPVVFSDEEDAVQSAPLVFHALRSARSLPLLAPMRVLASAPAPKIEVTANVAQSSSENSLPVRRRAEIPKALLGAIGAFLIVPWAISRLLALAVSLLWKAPLRQLRTAEQRVLEAWVATDSPRTIHNHDLARTRSSHDRDVYKVVQQQVVPAAEENVASRNTRHFHS